MLVNTDDFDLAVEKQSPLSRSKACSKLLLSIDELYERLCDKVSKKFTVYQRKFDFLRQPNISSIDEDCLVSRVCLFNYKDFSIFALLNTSSNTTEHVFFLISILM